MAIYKYTKEEIGNISEIYSHDKTSPERVYDHEKNEIVFPEANKYKWGVLGDSLSDGIYRDESNYARPHYYTVVANESGGRYELSNWPNHTPLRAEEAVAAYAVGQSGYSRSREVYDDGSLCNKYDGYNTNPERTDVPPYPKLSIDNIDSFYTRMNDMESDCDVVTVLGSINDWRVSTNTVFGNQASVPLGVFPDTENGTNSLQWLKSNPINIEGYISGTGTRDGKFRSFCYSHKACMAQMYFNWKRKVWDHNHNAKLVICSLPFYNIDYNAFGNEKQGYPGLGIASAITNIRKYTYDFAVKYGLQFYDFTNEYAINGDSMYKCNVHTTVDGTADTSPNNALTDKTGARILDKNGRAVDWYGKSLWCGYLAYKNPIVSGETQEQYIHRMAERIQFARLFMGDYTLGNINTVNPVWEEIAEEAGIASTGKYPASGGHWNTLYNKVAFAPMFKDILDYETGATQTRPANLLVGAGLSTKSLEPVMARGITE